MQHLSFDLVHSLATKHKTPLYIYSKKAFKKQGESALNFKVPYGLTVRYAMKANPHDEILKLFNDLGIHFDASSEYEAYRAVNAGITADKIALNSQQLPKDLKQFCERGFFFVATSIHQLKEYAKFFPGTQVGVRLNPGCGSGYCKRVTTGGVSAGFGIWHEYIPEVLEIAKQHNLTISTVHTHIGGGADPIKWQEAAQQTLDLVKLFHDATTVNLGGGFKVARMPQDKDADLSVISEGINNLLLDFEKETGRKMHLEIEPGTYLAANCGVLLSEIGDITDTGKDGYNFVRLNTGMNDFMRPTLYGAQHPITFVQKNPPTTTKDYVIIGHNCESGDILTPAPYDPEGILPRNLPECNIGDYVLIGGAGAYCASMRVTGYNSFIGAEEIFID